MAQEFDVVILGGGTGGYVAAIRAAQMNLSVAVVEKDKMGGTCLHRGCIPSKALLRSAEVYREAKDGERFGVETKEVSLNFTKVQERKQGIVDQLHKGVEALMKKGKIEVFRGMGRLLGPSIFSPMPGSVSVEFADGTDNEILIPKQLILATGSRPNSLPGLELDGEVILSSDHALTMEQLPKSIVIVGGGVIGIEWASMLADFGVEVTVVEYADRILPTEDRDISQAMKRALEKRGVTIHTGTKVLPDTVAKDDASVTIQADQNGHTVSLSAEKMLVSVGRKANVEGIGLENTDIAVEKGVIQVNKFLQTKESHIYAIGDCIGGLQLAHVASHEGIKAVEHIANVKTEPIDYSLIAKCIYSTPEVSSVGYTEAEAKEQGYDVKVGKFSFQAIGKALVYGETDGFVKIVADKETDDVLGVHMMGPHVTDMIAEGALARVLNATPWEIGETIHPHPTLSEAIGEAALAVDGKAIHQ